MHETHHKTHKTHPTHFFILSLILLGAIVTFTIVFQNMKLAVSRAYGNSATITIKLHGNFSPPSKIPVQLILYRSLGKVKEYKNILFIAQSDNTLEGTIFFDRNFDFSAFYAVYIKPDNYFGRLFCNSYTSGKQCKSPQFVFNKNGSIWRLTGEFYGGDIIPVNGRVDAQDISTIIDNLGKSNDLSTDINNDGMTNTLDYTLALYSLENNISDDQYTLEVPWAPTFAPLEITPTYIPQRRRVTPTPVRTGPGVCQLLPAPFSVGLCGVTTETIYSSVKFGACRNIYATTKNCSPVFSRQHCSCPNGYICKCQLKDQLKQTVECTHGGRLEVIECEKNND